MKSRILLSAIASLMLAAPTSAQVANGRVTTAAPTYSAGVPAPLSLDTAGNLRVGFSGGVTANQGAAGASPWPVSAAQTGTWTVTGAGGVFPATQSGAWIVGQSGAWAVGQSGAWSVGQSGTWTVQPGNVANTTPWLVNAAQSAAGYGGLIQTDASAPINVSTATTTQIVALSAAKKIYVTALDVIAGGTGNVTFVYGTGAACGTGTTALTGPYPLTAQAGLAKGSGLAPVLIVPASNALCVTTSAAVQVSGSVSYTQF